MIEILDIFEQILADARSVDMAESQFKCMICDDPEIRAAYRQWCEDEGTTEKYGFVDYCNQRFDEEESCWDTLNDDDNYE